MSKFADLLRRAGRAEPAPLGFAAAGRKTAPGMLLVGAIRERWRQGVTDAVSAGADAVLLSGRVGDKELAESIDASAGRPCGVLVAEADASTPERLRSAGADFLVVELQSAACALLDEQLGFILRLPDELTDVQLRALEALSLDALYLERAIEPLTLARQLDLARVASLSRKRLLLRVGAELEPPDLVCLRDMAVTALAVDLHERRATDILRGLRAKVDAMPPPRQRRREERPEPLLPRAAVAVESDQEDDEEEYDE